MDRLVWLKQMREMNEAVYNSISSLYWVKFGFYDNSTHLEYLRKFMEKLPKGGTVLSAACGAGRYDGIILEAGHSLTGTDQSEGMLDKAREHFPQARYIKMGLQEMNFDQEFDGAICMDALENVPPEDWPGSMHAFSRALKPGGWLYFTVEIPEPGDVKESYRRAAEMDLPVIYGELADKVEQSYRLVIEMTPQEILEKAPMLEVYHYYPSWEQVRAWTERAGLQVEEEGEGSGYRHFLLRKP